MGHVQLTGEWHRQALNSRGHADIPWKYSQTWTWQKKNMLHECASFRNSQHEFTLLTSKTCQNITFRQYWNIWKRIPHTHSYVAQQVLGDRGSTVVTVLRYKSEGRWFDYRWCHWNFLHNPSDRTMALGSTQPLTEMSTGSISWG